MSKKQRNKAVAWMNGQILLLEAKLAEYESPEVIEHTEELIDALEATTVFLLNLPEDE